MNSHAPKNIILKCKKQNLQKIQGRRRRGRRWRRRGRGRWRRRRKGEGGGKEKDWERQKKLEKKKRKKGRKGPDNQICNGKLLHLFGTWADPAVTKVKIRRV